MLTVERSYSTRFSELTDQCDFVLALRALVQALIMVRPVRENTRQHCVGPAFRTPGG
jgi:hypothetical protein